MTKCYTTFIGTPCRQTSCCNLVIHSSQLFTILPCDINSTLILFINGHRPGIIKHCSTKTLLPLILLPFLLGMLILILLRFCWQWFQGVTFNPMQLLKDSKTVCGFDLKQIRHHPDLKMEAMEHLIQLYSEGKIKPVIDQVYAFEEVSFTLTRQANWLACKLQ